MPLAVGSRLGPYEIVAKLGAGGMGEVWRARDPRLEREVAIKLVRGDGLDESRRRRFEHEARAVGRVQHPNLLVVHDVGEHEGEPFLVTELVAGETLRERIERGPLALDEALALAREIALGLGAAHAAGLVHRDLKPENVIVTAEFRVKLLDFGLAKSVGAAAGEGERDARTWTQLTEPGLVVGTCGYMAPEQVRGEWVDQRADLFALGAILHELLSGRAPFARAAPLESLTAILAEPAPRLPPGVPPAVARVVERCLEKEPGRRCASAEELVEALEAARGPAAARAAAGESAPRSVAVLPFRGLAGGAENEELGLGIADAIVTELAAARALVVRPTAAILRFRGREVEPRAAGRELGVDAVLDGHFQRAGSRLRVTLQLVETASAQPLWATKIDGSLDDPFRLQDEIAHRVAGALAGELARRPSRAERAAPAAGAYEYYLRGRAHLARESLSAANEAVDALEAAVAADPRFALGWAGLADAYLMLHLEFDPDDDWYRRAEAACARALELDPALPEGRYLRGRLAWSTRGGWDHAAALRECAAAVAARPGLHEAWHRLGTVLCHVSLFDASSACFARAYSINPRDYSSYAIWGFCRLLELRLDEALEISDRVWAETPSPWVAYQRLQCRIHLGRRREAEELTLAACRQFPASPLLVSLRALLAALAGDAAEARRGIEQVERNRRALNHYHHAQYEVATSLAHLGEREAALAQLGEAARNGFPCFDFFARDPLLEPLRGEPGFADLLAGLEREKAGYAGLWAELGVAL
jgi:serine/threonine-protein kinase